MNIEKNDTLSIILVKIESMEKRVDKMYDRLFITTDDENRSVCDILYYHNKKIKTLEESTFSKTVIKLGGVAGAILSLSAVIVGAVLIIQRLI